MFAGLASLQLFNHLCLLFKYFYSPRFLKMKFPAILSLLFLAPALNAQKIADKKPAEPAGYEIRVTLKPLKNEFIYLGHYYGKQLPIVDSARMNEKGEAVFKGSKKLGEGIYLVGFPDKARNFEILVDKNQHFSVIADTGQLANVSFVNSQANVDFKEYQLFMNTNGRTMDSLYNLRRSAGLQDSIKYTLALEALNQGIKNYRKDILQKDPNGLLSTLLQAMREPEVPQNDPAAQTDSMFAYKYFKKHYWDGVQFTDDRVIRTPFFESRVDKYFEQLVYPSADSVIKEMDWMMSYANVNDEMQKFMLLKFINRYLNQKYMWEDAVFVHLFEKYFAQKDYPWLAEKGRKIITDRAYSLMSNIMGNPAAEVLLPDSSGKKISLYGVEAPFVLVAIWDPTCGHCKEVLPKLDSLYQAKWKSYGLKFYGLAKETDGNKKDWLGFINSKNLGYWNHVYYSKEDDQARIKSGIPGYSQLYDVQSFPTLYLLDKEKRIIAKKVTPEQVDEILQFRLKTN
jgi:thiol-disulfide isomerase/thioredoxin